MRVRVILMVILREIEGESKSEIERESESKRE